MNLSHAPRSPQKSSHDSSATDSASYGDQAPDLQDSWGNQALASMANAFNAIVPIARGLSGAVEHEGWGVIGDINGALARQDGRDALADKMVVLKPGEQGTGAPNEVDEATFEALAKQYAEIREGECDLQIDTSALGYLDAGDFEGGVMEDITRMMQTPSGRELLQVLTHQKEGQTTQIMPTLGNNTPGMAPGWNDADRDGPALLASYSEIEERLHNGVGTSTVIRYQPGQYFDSGHQAWDHARSDVVLAHEMVHAAHGANGDIPDMHVLLDEQFIEHQATGLDTYAGEELSENVYRAERRALVGSPGALPDDALAVNRDKYCERY